MISGGEGGSFNHAKFLTRYEKYRASGNLDEMLTKSQRQGLDKLARISRDVQWSERIAGNPSGTGHMVINDLRKWVRHPVWSVTEALGAKRLAKNYFQNPEFQKSLVEGLKLPATSIRAKAIARSMALAAVTEEREEMR